MALRVRVELDRARVLAVGISLASPRVAEVTRLILNRAKVLTPVRTGNLRASERMVMRVRPTFVAGRVEATAKYAEWVHNRTLPHVIAARRRKALRFVGRGGQVVFRRMVVHPGSKGKPFLTRAMTEIAPLHGFEVKGLPGIAVGEL